MRILRIAIMVMQRAKDILLKSDPHEMTHEF